MDERITRREALLRIASVTTVVGATGAVGRGVYDPGHRGPLHEVDQTLVRNFGVPRGLDSPRFAISRSSSDPAELTRRAIEALGGMRHFVSRGDVVVVKPNIGWDRLPIHGANTNPEVVAEVVRLAFDAGAKQVVVSDVSCNDPNRCFQRSGIWRAAHSLGATVILPAEHRFREVRIHGEMLNTWPVYVPFIEADKVINVPIAKHHNLSKFTGGMKNWYGMLGGRRNRLHQNIDVSVADLATFMRPTLTVLDATRVLVRNGPQGGNIDDTKELHQVIAGLDPVAIDAYGATLIGADPRSIRYLSIGEERNLGRRDWQNVAHVEV